MTKHTPGPWRVEIYQSSTVYIHMRNASGKSGPAIMGPDFTDQDGHVGAHTFLHNIAAFKALTGETEEDLYAERIANACLIAAAPKLLGALKRLLNASVNLHGSEAELLAIEAMTEAEGK